MLYKIILINLAKDKDRLEYMAKQLNDLGLEFERLEAINGKEYMETDGSEYDEELAIKKGGRSVKLGEIGCALSHKRCYERFLSDPRYKNVKYLLILEDDVELDKNFKSVLENEIYKNEKRYRWNYLQFNYPERGYFLKEKYKNQFLIFKTSIGIKHRIIRLPLLFFAPLVSSFLYFLSKNKKGMLPFFMRIYALCGAYLIDKKTASILLSLTQKITKPIDATTSQDLYKYKNKNMNFYFYIPLIARQKNEKFRSSIDEIEKRS